MVLFKYISIIFTVLLFFHLNLCYAFHSNKDDSSYQAFVTDKSNQVIIFTPAKIVDSSGIALINTKLVKAWLDDVSYNLFVKDNKGNIYLVKHLISYSQRHNIAIVSLETQGKSLVQTEKLISNSSINEFILNAIAKYKQNISKITKKEESRLSSHDKPTFEPKIETPSIKDLTTKKEPHQYYEIAKILLQEKKLSDAEQNLQELLSIDKNHIEATMMMAQIYTATGRFKEAESLYKKSYKLTNSIEVIKKLAVLYLMTGDYAESIRQLNLYLNQNPVDAEAQFTLAINYLLSGNKESAFNQYIKLKKIDSKKSEELFDLLYR